MASTSSLTLSAQIQQAADEYGTTLTKPITALQDQRDILTSKSTAYNAIRTSMSAMNLSAGALSNSSSYTKFSVYTVASTNMNAVTATATTGDSIGTHTLLVTQLAKNDMAMSSRVTSADTDIAAAIGTTTKSFQISVNGVNTQIDVSLDGTENNQTVLTKIAAAVNAKLTTSGVSASVVTDTPTTSKLVFTSRTTGAVNAVGLSDLNGGNVLDSLGLTSGVLSGRTASTSTGAGFSYGDSTLLDAKFNLDGIDMTRSTNIVSDALPGMTLTLKSTQLPTDTPTTLTVSLDNTAIKANVQDFLTKYNSVISTIRSYTAVDMVAKTRQVLSEDTTYVQMRSSLRMMVMGQVSSVQSGNPTSLGAIGISSDANGNLSITDTTKFNAALSGGSAAAVSDLFNSSNGIAVQMKARMDNFVSTNGILDGNSKGVKDRISAIDKKIADYTARNAAKVQQYAQSLAQAQALLTQLSTQTSLASSYLAKVNAGSI